MERAVVLATGEALGPDCLPPELLRPQADARQPDARHADARQADDRLASAERVMLLQALEAHSGNISAAARELGISRDTLRYRIRKHGLQAG
jgi:DNA-binding NtrC family response regulator